MRSELLNYIIDENPYFQNGFDDVYLDETTGMVHNGEPIFPSDTLGNYFYLRLPNTIRFDSSDVYKISECENTPATIYDLILVACHKDADPNELLNNLITTLGKFDGSIVFTNASINSEAVILQELSSMSAENKEAALQRKPSNLTIVSISFTYTEVPAPNNCITEPCATC